jgi:hypothetical protein
MIYLELREDINSLNSKKQFFICDEPGRQNGIIIKDINKAVLLYLMSLNDESVLLFCQNNNIDFDFFTDLQPFNFSSNSYSEFYPCNQVEAWNSGVIGKIALNHFPLLIDPIIFNLASQYLIK